MHTRIRNHTLVSQPVDFASFGFVGSDLDALRERNGHVLILEFKRVGAGLPVGQLRALRTLHRGNQQVWVVQHSAAETEPAITLDHVVSFRSLDQDEWTLGPEAFRLALFSWEASAV